jgi:hypothetical protein
MAQTFRRLPESVVWVHDTSFGHGWKSFRLRSAVERAMDQARLLEGDVIAYLDADEFFAENSVENLFPRATGVMVKIRCVHWRKDGMPYVFHPP